MLFGEVGIYLDQLLNHFCPTLKAPLSRIAYFIYHFRNWELCNFLFLKGRSRGKISIKGLIVKELDYFTCLLFYWLSVALKVN